MNKDEKNKIKDLSINKNINKFKEYSKNLDHNIKHIMNKIKIKMEAK